MDINVDDSAVWWESGLAIDVDGAPNAYGPGNTGLDYTANAGTPAKDGKPANWYGVVTDNGLKTGTPVIQGAGDPYPGKWVSTTALQDKSKNVRDPHRYVDATQVAYLSVPSNEVTGHGLHPGDVAIVHCRKTGKTSAAVVGDVGPRNKYGEGSPKLASNIGVNADPRHGGCDAGVRVVVFRGSGRGWPRAAADIAQQASDLLQGRPDLQAFLTS